MKFQIDIEYRTGSEFFTRHLFYVLDRRRKRKAKQSKLDTCEAFPVFVGEYVQVHLLPPCLVSQHNVEEQIKYLYRVKIFFCPSQCCLTFKDGRNAYLGLCAIFALLAKSKV